MQTTFFIELGFWVEDLKVRYYKSHIGRNKIKNRTNLTL